MFFFTITKLNKYIPVCPPYTVCTNTRDVISQVRSYNDYHPSKSWFIKMRNSGNVLLHFKVIKNFVAMNFTKMFVLFLYWTMSVSKKLSKQLLWAHTTNYNIHFRFGYCCTNTCLISGLKINYFKIHLKLSIETII